MSSKHAIFALSATALLALGSTTATAEPVQIRINWSVAPAHITPMINEVPKDIYRHYGKSYVVKTIRMRGSGPALTALAAGEVEIAAMNNQAFALGVVNGKQKMKAIASVLQDKAPGESNGYWVRKDSGITKLSDLKGKVVAVNALGSGVHASAKLMLGEAGLRPGNDFQFVEVRFGGMLSALEGKRIDMGFLVLPFNLIAERTGKFKKMFTLRDALGENETVIWVAKNAYIEKNRAALVDFLEDHVRMRQWIYDPKNRMAGAEIVAKVMRRPVKNYASWIFTERDYMRAVDAKLDAAVLQNNVDRLHKLGVIPGTFDVSKYVDLSPVTEAGARIKP